MPRKTPTQLSDIQLLDEIKKLIIEMPGMTVEEIARAVGMGYYDCLRLIEEAIDKGEIDYRKVVI